jgi:surface carbohydrate biosynthesis protein (TIGR04326 family)
VLVITAGPLPPIPPELPADPRTARAQVLDLDGTAADSELPPGWSLWRPDDLIEASAVRRRFLAFLDAWPETTAGPGQSFRQRLALDDRYDAWWTSVGADRQATHGIFKYFRFAALLDAAIERAGPDLILLHTREPLATSLALDRARRSRIDVRLLPGCAAGGAASAHIGPGWLIQSARQALTSPLRSLWSAIWCRWVLRGTRLFRPSTGRALVFASPFFRYLEIRDGSFAPVNWKELCAAVQALEPKLQHAFLPWNAKHMFEAGSPGRPARRGVRALSGVDAPILIRERFFPLRGHGARLIRHLSLSRRLYQLSRLDGFEAACRFANTDLRPVIVPELMEAVAETTDWSLRQIQFARALRAAGRVQAVVLSEEMYRPSMPLLAAASNLGIPTVGVQHGTLMPAHLIYTLPSGHVRHAPAPDYFAAYGSYARETLSVHGAFPADRVWITGAARLDPLVNRPLDPAAARAALGLPADKKIVVLATQTFAWFTAAIRAVLTAMRDHPDAVLCVKKHPSTRAMPLQAIAALGAEIGAPDVRGFTGDIDLLLSASDVWISASSTTILEATLMGTPSICVNFSGEPDGYPYVEDGASLPGRSVDELAASLSHLLSGPVDDAERLRREAFLSRHAGPTARGQAALELATRLVNLAGLPAAHEIRSPD